MLAKARTAAFDGFARCEYHTQFSRALPDHRDAVVMYHAVGDPSKVGNISATRLERDLQYLSTRYDIVDLQMIGSGSTTGPKRVAVTFDDAYRNFYDNALPIVEALKIPVTLFVPTGFIEEDLTNLAYRFSADPDNKHGFNDPQQSRSVDAPDPNVISLEHLKDLAENDLVRLGNHTRTHPDLAVISDPVTLKQEIVDSQRWLRTQVGARADCFSFPYGRYSEAALRVVETSHKLAVTTKQGLLEGTESVYELPRIRGNISEPQFRWLLTDTNWRLRNWFG